MSSTGSNSSHLNFNPIFKHGLRQLLVQPQNEHRMVRRFLIFINLHPIISRIITHLFRLFVGPIFLFIVLIVRYVPEQKIDSQESDQEKSI